MQKNPESEFNVERVRAAVRARNFAAADQAIKNVYRNNEFVTLQAKVAPEEEMPEVYRYKVLLDASPKEPVFSLDGQEINVRKLLESDVVAKKVQCLRDSGFLTALP